MHEIQQAIGSTLVVLFWLSPALLLIVALLETALRRAFRPSDTTPWSLGSERVADTRRT